MMLNYIFVTVYCNVIWHDNNVRVYGFKNVIHFIFFAFFVHLLVKIELVKPSP